VALAAVAAQDFLFRQAVKKRRVLFETVDVLDLEVIAHDQWVEREYFRTALYFRKLGIFDDRFFVHGRSRMEQVT
jgi:hypothetical protein